LSASSTTTEAKPLSFAQIIGWIEPELVGRPWSLTVRGWTLSVPRRGDKKKFVDRILCSGAARRWPTLADKGNGKRVAA